MMRKVIVIQMLRAISIIWLFALLSCQTGNPGFNSHIVKGRFGDALDASMGPAVSKQGLPVRETQAMTIELWCQLSNSDFINILIANGTSESATNWEIYTETRTGTLSALFSGYKPSVIKTSRNITDGEWHYVALTFDGERVSLFVDGMKEAENAVLKNSDLNFVSVPVSLGLTRGQFGVVKGISIFDGAIDEVRISGYIRNITGIPDGPFQVDEHTLALWDFDHVIGTTGFSDASGYHNPLTVSNVSLSKADRFSYQAGPSPLDSPVREISLKEGYLNLPGIPSVFSLDGDWQLVEGGNLEERVNDVWLNSIKAPVPGSVHTALFQAGIIPDPYIGKNQETARLWSYKTYYYKKTFPRPPKEFDKELVFQGICNRCTIWLNGEQLGVHEGMFDPVEYPLKDRLKDENTLVVKLDTALDYKKTVVFNNSYGWHYSKFPPLGIWRSVYIRGEPTVKMQSPFVATRDAKAGIMDLVITITGKEAGWKGRFSGVIEPENFEGRFYHFEMDIGSDSGSRDLHYRFKIPDPRLWWPVDLGEPDLYKLKLALVPRNEGVADVQEITFGIRTVEMGPVNGKPHPDLFDWTFIINGEPVFVKGAGWCTPDAMMDFSRERYDRFLSLARSQHVQMLRAWGSGMVETDDFYDLCDRKGIMVMQEWPTSVNTHTTIPFEMLERTVRFNTIRLRNHPSLVIYTGGNEINHPYGPAIDMMGKLNIELDGTREFHRGQPAGGSTHDYAVYWGRKHIDHAFTMKAIFYGEYGIASYPNYESVLRFLPDKEKNLWPPQDDGSFAYHTPCFNRTTAKDMERLTLMSHYFTEGETMEKFIEGSQLAQAVGTRHAAERARTRWPKSTGALYYKLNDNCPAASWSTVDWYGAPKISHYLMQDSFSPLVAVVLFPKASSYGLSLVMPVFLLDDADALKDSPWEVRVRAFGADLKLISEMKYNGRGSISKVKHLGDFSLDSEQTKSAPLFMVMDVLKRGILVQRNYNFTNFEPIKDCLFNLPKSNVIMTVHGDTAIVKNMGSLPAVGVNIRWTDHLDTFSADDNYCWLDAGETKIIKVSKSTGLEVAGWNIEK